MFAQRVKSGSWVGGFAEYTNSVLTSGMLDYHGRIEKWRAIVPEAESVVRPFDKSQWHEGSLFHDFFQSLGWPDLTRIEGVRLREDFNRVPDVQMLSLAREINRRLEPHRESGQSLGFARLQYELDQRGWRDLGDDQRIDLFSPQELPGTAV